MRYSVRSLARPLLENADKKLIKSKGEVNRLKILVCVKQVPDTTEIKIDPVTNTLIRNGVPSIVNPFDKNALEAALQLKDKYGAEVTVLSMGPGQAAEALRECYAMGADNMVLVSDRAFGGADTLATSYTLSAAIRALGEFDLILCGKQAIDGDTAQVGPEIAEHLGIPQVTYAADIELNDTTLTVTKEQEDCYEKIEVKLPALLTAVKSLNEPRYPNIRRKMQANRMEVRTLTAADLPELDPARLGLKGSPTKVKKTFVPPVHSTGVRVEGKDAGEQVGNLLKLLSEAKITF